MSQRSTSTLPADLATSTWVSGDRAQAMSIAFANERRAMYAIARRVVGEHLAADAAQDALCRVWRHPHRFDPSKGTLGSYLRIAVHGTAIDMLRSDVARQRRDENDRRAHDVHAADALPTILLDEVRRNVIAALEALPEAERQSIIEAFYGRRSYRDIAQRHSLPEGTVKSRIRTGMKRLKVILDDPNLVHDTDHPELDDARARYLEAVVA